MSPYYDMKSHYGDKMFHYIDMMPFQLAWTKFEKSYCTTPGICFDVGVSKLLKFYVKVFYVMGKGLTGKLSCPVTGLVIVAAL